VQRAAENTIRKGAHDKLIKAASAGAASVTTRIKLQEGAVTSHCRINLSRLLVYQAHGSFTSAAAGVIQQEWCSHCYSTTLCTKHILIYFASFLKIFKNPWK